MRTTAPKLSKCVGVFMLSLCVLFGCEDETKPTPTVNTPDVEVSALDASTSGADIAPAEPDQSVEADMQVIDAEVVDTFVELEPDIGPLLIQDEECSVPDDCGQYERCAGGICRLDLRPDVFRVNTIEVIEPKLSAAFGEYTHGWRKYGQLTLLVEPGRYDEAGNGRWYMGNGNGIEPYVYLHRFPFRLLWVDGAAWIRTLTVSATKVRIRSGTLMMKLASS